MRRIVIAPALLALVAVVGCTGGTAEGEVSGKVTINKKPLPGGFVMFRHADGKHNLITVELDKDGNYPPTKIPVGEVSVIIDNRELAPAVVLDITPGGVPLSAEAKKNLKPEGGPRKGGTTKRSDRYVPIPERYHMTETSGLKFKVERGSQKKDFELTSD